LIEFFKLEDDLRAQEAVLKAGRRGPAVAPSQGSEFAGLNMEAAEARTRLNATGERTPTDLTMRAELAVNNLPGLAKLVTRRPPTTKSAARMGNAAGSP
jgi:hypothetical protein